MSEFLESATRTLFGASPRSVVPLRWHAKVLTDVLDKSDAERIYGEFSSAGDLWFTLSDLFLLGVSDEGIRAVVTHVNGEDTPICKPKPGRAPFVFVKKPFHLFDRVFAFVEFKKSTGNGEFEHNRDPFVDTVCGRDHTRDMPCGVCDGLAGRA